MTPQNVLRQYAIPQIAVTLLLEGKKEKLGCGTSVFPIKCFKIFQQLENKY